MLHGSVCCYVGKKALRQFLQGEEGRDMVLYEVPLLVFVGFCDSDYVCQLPCIKSTTIRTRASFYYVFPQLVKCVIIHYLIDLYISPLNLYLYIHLILDFK